MAKVSYIDVPPDLKGAYDQLFTPLYKTRNASVRFTGALTPPRAKIKTSTKSLLPQISALWAALSPTEQAAWKAAGASQNYNAWNAFVQDTSYRLKYGVEGLAEPSPLHMYKCGKIIVEPPATAFRLVQVHPVEYYKMRKVRGTKSQYEPVAIREVLSLPLQVAASYRANLTATGPEPYCKFYAEVTYSYQATDKIATVGFDIPLVCEWQRQEQTLAYVVGHARWYTLVFEFSDVQGTIEFDAIQSLHTGTNFARDFRCTNINAGFSNTNYQLPPSWAADDVVDGVAFDSIYPSDLPL